MHTGIFGQLVPPPQQNAAQYQHWQGQSGAWWITTVYTLGLNLPAIPSVYLMVRRGVDGKCSPIYIGQTDDLRRRIAEHEKDKLLSACILGANELHAHFLAKTERQRFAVESDLRNGHATPLNVQPSAAMGGLFGLYRAGEQKSLLGQVGSFR